MMDLRASKTGLAAPDRPNILSGGATQRCSYPRCYHWRTANGWRRRPQSHVLFSTHFVVNVAEKLVKNGPSL